MKCLTLLMHAAVSDTFVDALRDDSVVSGFTVTRCEGHSANTADEPQVGARDLVVGHVPRVRIDLVLAAKDVDGVLGRLRAIARSDRSWGTWFVSDVDAFGHL